LFGFNGKIPRARKSLPKQLRTGGFSNCWVKEGFWQHLPHR
jgi:hypothetical protein